MVDGQEGNTLRKYIRQRKNNKVQRDIVVGIEWHSLLTISESLRAILES